MLVIDMVLREIVQIDEDKCTGCALCIPNCHEGALQIVGGKARLVKDVYCDGLGNCLGHCPEDAITIVKKDVNDFDFEATNENLRKQGMEELTENPLEKVDAPTPKAPPPIACGCPGTMVRDLRSEEEKAAKAHVQAQESQLRQWPIQLHLLPPHAPFFKGADLIVMADCVGVSYPDLHQKLIKGKAITIACPKLDDTSPYVDKLQAIIAHNGLASLTVATMEVPCCHGLYIMVKQALEASGIDLRLKHMVIGVDGSVLQEQVE